jgi:hypothetical protein
MAEKCKKSFCMKQVNPNIPNLYFGTPFERDENWGGCYLCGMGLGARYILGEPITSIFKPKLIKRQF